MQTVDCEVLLKTNKTSKTIYLGKTGKKITEKLHDSSPTVKHGVRQLSLLTFQEILCEPRSYTVNNWSTLDLELQ